MFETAEFLLRARLETASLEAWIEAGWLAPPAGQASSAFSDMDLARAWLIRELQEDLGVNEEGVAVVLGLLDQLHGTRAALRRLTAVLAALPEPLRRELLAELRGEAGPSAGEGRPRGA